jgi:hypothetical protein
MQKRTYEKVDVKKVSTDEDVRGALEVIEEVYLREKGWIHLLDRQIPEDVARDDRVSWFLCRVRNKPAGVLRLLYDPRIEIPSEYGVMLNDGVDLQKLSAAGRFVEIGRFAVKPVFRRNLFVALRLMRSAIREVVERNYTHFITDVFEGEANSPFHFHTRLLGFEVIGRHLHGDLDCSCTRIILTLDILKAYQRLKRNRSRILSSLTEDFTDELEKKLAANL